MNTKKHERVLITIGMWWHAGNQFYEILYRMLYLIAVYTILVSLLFRSFCTNNNENQNFIRSINKSIFFRRKTTKAFINKYNNLILLYRYKTNEIPLQTILIQRWISKHTNKYRIDTAKTKKMFLVLIADSGWLLNSEAALLSRMIS